LPEDAGKQAETDIQNTLNDFSANVDKHLELKEKEIMTV
jgi:ribosome recycling factor